MTTKAAAAPKKGFRGVRVQLDFVIRLPEPIDDLPKELPDIVHHVYRTLSPAVARALDGALRLGGELIVEPGARATVSLVRNETHKKRG
jgi:hypothetical protein